MKKEIVDLLGPVGMNWEFEEEEIVRAQGRRIRAFVKLTLKKGPLSPKKKITIKVWGSAYGYSIESKKEAVENAINMGIKLLGLHQDTPTPLSSIIEQVGPLGLQWGYEEKDSFIRNGNVICTVEVNVPKSLVSLNGKGKGTIKHQGTGYASTSSEYPEDEALINAIMEAFSWFGIVPESDEYEETFTTSDRLPEKKKDNGKKILAIAAVLAIGTVICAGFII